MRGHTCKADEDRLEAVVHWLLGCDSGSALGWQILGQPDCHVLSTIHYITEACNTLYLLKYERQCWLMADLPTTCTQE